MKILLDTNIVLDVLLARSPFDIDAKNIFKLIEQKQHIGYLCATTITTLYYLISKSLSKEEANTIIKQLLTLFEVASVDKNTLLEALKNNGADYEDSVIYSSAYLAKIDVIITRDKSGFEHSKVTTMPPYEFIQSS